MTRGSSKAAQAFHVEHDHAPHLRQPVGDLQVLVELLVVLDEQHHAARVAAQVFDLRRRIGGVDAVAHAAHRLNGQVAPDPFAAGVGQHRGHLARLEAHG